MNKGAFSLLSKSWLEKKKWSDCNEMPAWFEYLYNFRPKWANFHIGTMSVPLSLSNTNLSTTLHNFWREVPTNLCQMSTSDKMCLFHLCLAPIIWFELKHFALYCDANRSKLYASHFASENDVTYLLINNIETSTQFVCSQVCLPSYPIWQD